MRLTMHDNKKLLLMLNRAENQQKVKYLINIVLNLENNDTLFQAAWKPRKNQKTEIYNKRDMHDY
ncbi:Uncharacterised protein [Suttonella indologenes]|uniref:Uncharacterized protein n=1 Tax=Suttonella indologenes TaxID=13276 RepID=A0A380N3E6_9GAMM|nr:Uncharacterised protein [Suttonella indologenes]